MSDDSRSSEDTFATEMSFEVEDFSPPESPVDQSSPEPYQFEPLAQAAGAESAGAEEEGQERMGDVSEWCSCGHCTKLSPRENICCKEVAKVMHRCEQIGGAACVTAHPGFEPVALNPYVLQAVYGTYRQLYGEMQEPELNSCYRHLAYRNFVRWCWGYLGQHIRVVIPSCAVTRIRQEFPETGETYTGFQLPPLE